jgi:hypothetical protein
MAVSPMTGQAFFVLRRYHRLTRRGRSALAEEAEVRAATARVVRVRLGHPGPQAAW